MERLRQSGRLLEGEVRTARGENQICTRGHCFEDFLVECNRAFVKLVSRSEVANNPYHENKFISRWTGHRLRFSEGRNRRPSTPLARRCAGRVGKGRKGCAEHHALFSGTGQSNGLGSGGLSGRRIRGPGAARRKGLRAVAERTRRCRLRAQISTGGQWLSASCHAQRRSAGVASGPRKSSGLENRSTPGRHHGFFR